MNTEDILEQGANDYSPGSISRSLYVAEWHTPPCPAITAGLLAGCSNLPKGQVSEDMFGLGLAFEHLNVLACKMELEFIPIWFQLSRVRTENERSALVVTESLIRAEDVDDLVDDKGPEIAGAEFDSSRLFDEKVAEVSVECRKSANKKG